MDNPDRDQRGYRVGGEVREREDGVEGEAEDDEPLPARRSESRPKTGMSRARETEKPEKIAPISSPVAPRVSAYRGRSGITIPRPSKAEKTATKRAR